MGLLDRMINNVVSSASRSAGHAIGDAIGDAVGKSVGNLAEAGTESITTDIKIKNEEKMMDLAERQKAENLPPNCPHCGAPSNKQLVCEYCHCKIVQ